MTGLLLGDKLLQDFIRTCCCLPGYLRCQTVPSLLLTTMITMFVMTVMPKYTLADPVLTQDADHSRPVFLLDGHIPLEDYEIIYPEVVGSFAHGQHRLKRGVNSTENIIGDQIYLNITAFGEDYMIELLPTRELFAPGFQIYHHSFKHLQNNSYNNASSPSSSLSSSSSQSSSSSSSSSSFYSHSFYPEKTFTTEYASKTNSTSAWIDTVVYEGTAVNQENMVVSITLVHGQLRGVLMTPDEDYLIEPVQNITANPSASHDAPALDHLVQLHAHVIYRASTVIRIAGLFDKTSRETSEDFLKIYCNDWLGNRVWNDWLGNRASLSSASTQPSRSVRRRWFGPGRNHRRNRHYRQQHQRKDNSTSFLYKHSYHKTGHKLHNIHKANIRQHIRHGNNSSNSSSSNSRHFIRHSHSHNESSTHRKRRQRRSKAWNHDITAEILVVADKSVISKHKHEDLNTYLLSILNVVSKLYRHSSLGKTINIVLTGLVILDTDEPGLKISYHAGKMLQSFCQWQAAVQGINKRHDHAVLITGMDICSYQNRPCDTLGYAHVDGMCSPSTSCSMAEDTGLSTAYTIAHELGHNFGMYHDGESNHCSKEDGNIMSPKLIVSGRGSFKWSSCSRAYLNRFLSKPQAKCLWSSNNYASGMAELRFPQALPGELYSADKQCKWLFGRHSKQCKHGNKKGMCRILWCEVKGYLCQTKFLPLADGTPCGLKQWCQNGKCVIATRKRLKPIEGDWSGWSSWSACSQTCGGGVTQRERFCDNPIPQFGGRPCKGPQKEHKVCHSERCPGHNLNSRQKQCHRYNSQPFHGRFYNWRPYKGINNDDDRCKLYCQADGFNFISALSQTVNDGTLCNEHSYDICIDGTCRRVGCDLGIDSDALEDICGVCRGDNSTCKTVTGEFHQQPAQNSYFPITILPANARHVYVQEKAVSRNFLALKNIYGKYKLNGLWRIRQPASLQVAGALFEYKRENNVDSLSAVGPLKEDLVLEILIQAWNPGVYYEYTIPDSARKPVPSPERPVYKWQDSRSNCSRQCGGGTQALRVSCVKDGTKRVNPAYCNQKHRPREGTIQCNTQPCPARWVTLEWKPCTKTCGGGKQIRKVRCKQQVSSNVDRRVNRRLCAGETKPHKRQWCNVQDCPSSWAVGRWTQCSVTCGQGVLSRPVSCGRQTVRGYKIQDYVQCESSTRPLSKRKCEAEACPHVASYQWFVSAWGQCSQTCGEAIRQRHLQCRRRTSSDGNGYQSVANGYCIHLSKPDLVLQERCSQPACQTAKWYTSQWSGCSVTCGNGVQTRQVLCKDQHGPKSVYACDWKKRPLSTRGCHLDPCPVKADIDCVDQFTWCYLVPHHGVCHHQYYGSQCCKSCKGRT